MSIYRVTTPPMTSVVNEISSRIVHVRFAPSEGGAKQHRRELAEAYGFKLADVLYAPIDLKPGKAGFIEYMNAFHAQAPADYKPAGYIKAAKAPAKKAAVKKKAKK